MHLVALSFQWHQSDSQLEQAADVSISPGMFRIFARRSRANLRAHPSISPISVVLLSMQGGVPIRDLPLLPLTLNHIMQSHMLDRITVSTGRSVLQPENHVRVCL